MALNLPRFLAGARQIDGQALNDMNDAAYSVVNGLTAKAGGGQANAPILQGAVNVVTTVATVADSFRLPVTSPSGVGMTVINNTANSTTVYPGVGGTINGASPNTGVAVAAGKIGRFIPTANNTWFLHLSA